MSRLLIPLSFLLAAAALVGCEEQPAPGPQLPLDGSDGGAVDPDDTPIGSPPTAEPDDPSLQLRRLTRGELQRTLAHVLGPIVLIDAEPDLHRAGFARVGARQVTTSTSGVERYAFALEDALDQVFGDPVATAALAPCPVEQPGCARQALPELGRRAFRRPLTADELSSREALIDACGGALPGLRCAVASLIYSPHFIYRVELPTDGVYTGYAMASRLAYFLWGGPPDDALLDAAAAGELDTAEGVRLHATRMMDDPRARVGLRSFVDEWFRTDRLERLGRDVLAVTYEPVQFQLGREGTLQPWLQHLVHAAGEELRRMVEHHVFDLDADYMDLLTTDTTVIDSDLLDIYQLGFDEEGFPVQVRSGEGEEIDDEGDDEDEEGPFDEGECRVYCTEDCVEADEDDPAECAEICDDECAMLAAFYANPQACDDACWNEWCPEEDIADCEAFCDDECAEFWGRDDGDDGDDEGDEDEDDEGGEEAARVQRLELVGQPDADGFVLARHRPDSDRRGLMGTMAMLGQLGKQSETSPTRRGLYIMRRILCLEVGEPPDDIDLCHRPDGVSRRDSMENHHLCAAACAGCHSQTDPIGFALDGFDTIGRVRRVDDWGYPLNTAVDWRLVRADGSHQFQFDSLTTMAQTFRELPEATECVTRQVYRFGTGRSEALADQQTIGALNRLFTDNGRRLKPFLVAFTATDAFRRAPSEDAGHDGQGEAPDLARIHAEILGPECGACHIGSALGGLDLAADAGLMDRLRAPSSTGMPFVTPGDPSQSYLWHKVAGTHADVGGAGTLMPPPAPLSDDHQQRLRAWIEAL